MYGSEVVGDLTIPHKIRAHCKGGYMFSKSIEDLLKGIFIKEGVDWNLDSPENSFSEMLDQSRKKKKKKKESKKSVNDVSRMLSQVRTR